jgi:hypothetical protein
MDASVRFLRGATGVVTENSNKINVPIFLLLIKLCTVALTNVNVEYILSNVQDCHIKIIVELDLDQMSRSKHPNKEIETAILYAEKHGWTYKDSGKSAHAWGKLFCPLHTREGHIIHIWSTPRSAHNHATD